MITPNNFSIAFCKELCYKNKISKVKNKNVVAYKNRLYSFSVSNLVKRIECRQVYANTFGIISFSKPDGNYYLYECLPSGSVSRISPDGVKAYSMTIPKEKCSMVKFR